MKVCDSFHTEIAHNEGECPLCAMRDIVLNVNDLCEEAISEEDADTKKLIAEALQLLHKGLSA